MLLMPAIPMLMMLWIRFRFWIIRHIIRTLFYKNLAGLIPKHWTGNSGTNGSCSFLSLASSGCL